MLTEESIYLITYRFGSLKTIIPFKLLLDTCLMLSSLWIYMNFVAVTHCHSLMAVGHI